MLYIFSSLKFQINHANNDWTKMFDMIRISKKWLKTDRDCLSIHKLYVFNLICTLHNTTAQYGLLSIDITIHLSFNLIPNVYNRPPLSFGFNNPSVRPLLCNYSMV